MRPYRATAITVGILFIACSAASVLSALPVGAILADPDYLSTLAGSAGSVVLTALIEFIWAATAAGIAIALYPILERFHPGWAFGAVAARLVEGTFILVGTLSLLVLLSVSQQSVAAGAPGPSSFQQIGDMLLV
uniref:DUF4386 family protein n=1 Tax=Salinibacterium sp. TaxID=1915057 RepID=UPI00286A78DF